MRRNGKLAEHTNEGRNRNHSLKSERKDTPCGGSDQKKQFWNGFALVN